MPHRQRHRETLFGRLTFDGIAVFGTIILLGTLSAAAITPAAAAATPTWTQQSPATSPPARYAASMAYDQTTSQLVLFGGFDSKNTVLGDPWTWDGSTWTQQTPTTSPPARYYPSMAYDPATSQLVLFGGRGANGGLLGDTWTWNGSTWTQQSPTLSPPARVAASLAYDPATSQLVLFGGVTGPDGQLGDTWTWNGSTWTQQSPVISPPARWAASMAYDPAASQLVLFGGEGQDGLLGDTWTWDGSTWTQQSPTTSPPARNYASMAYDTAASQLVLFGGEDRDGNAGDTWTWDGNAWTQQSPATSPPARLSASMAYDTAASQLVLFGGASNNGIVGDTWTYASGRQPQSITFSSTAPSSASYSGANDQAYTATATATSELPVTLSVDSSSTSGCVISGGTVSYGSGAGTCIIDANQPGNSFYLPAAQVTQRFTISQTSLSITASSAAMIYGGTVPVIIPSYSGFAGNDSPSSLSAPPSCSTTATSASPAGTYPSTCSGAADPNYTISYSPGTVTVKKATTITTLTSHLDPSARQPRLKLTATVIPGASAQTPAGDVNFYAGTPAHYHRLLGTAFLTTTGTAVFTTTTLACGRHRLYAIYVGNANDKGSTSATIRCGRRSHRHTGGTGGKAKQEPETGGALDHSQLSHIPPRQIRI